MPVFLGMPLAFIGTGPAKLGAGLDHATDQGGIGVSAAGENRPGGSAGIGAVEVEPDALAQSCYPFLAEAGVCTGDAGLGAIEAGFDATDQRVAGRAAAGMRVAQEHRADMHRLLLLFRNAED
ncbi:hypothetical protein [Reyranella massiliensis]|uniref:hypothetical protein n=1 Tax=Reyranella massiliensis TaxID=445220 RepID=UPI00315D484F